MFLKIGRKQLLSKKNFVNSYVSSLLNYTFIGYEIIINVTKNLITNYIHIYSYICTIRL